MIATVFPARISRRLSDRCPELGAIRKEIVGRHNADHREALPVECQLLIEYAHIAAKEALPQTIAEHRNGGRARLVLVVREKTPMQWTDAQGRKHVSRDLPADQTLGLAAAGQVVPLATKDSDV